jgi:hypothetical protein
MSSFTNLEGVCNFIIRFVLVYVFFTLNLSEFNFSKGFRIILNDSISKNLDGYT